MEYRRLGTQRPRGLRDQPRLLAHLLGGGVEREQAAACIDRAFERRDQLHRHRQRLRARRRRGAPRGAARRAAARLLRARDEALLPDGRRDRGLSRGADRTKQIDASLRRLRTDYVDLYQCHRYDEDTPLEETMEALTEVVRAGKARYIGFSEWSAEQIAAALALPDVEHFVASQPQYSLLWRAPEARRDPALRAKGISQIVWSPLAQGVLTGSTGRRAAPAGSRAAQDDGVGDGPLPHGRGLRGGRAPPPDRPRTPGSRLHSSRSRGCCASRTSRPRSSAPRARSSSTKRVCLRCACSTRTRSRRSTRRSPASSCNQVKRTEHRFTVRFYGMDIASMCLEQPSS